MTRDALIVISGSKAKGRDFVYWTEVKDIPSTDLATIERLWQQFSGGKFGYSVQKVRYFLVSSQKFQKNAIRSLIALVKIFSFAEKMEAEQRRLRGLV